MRMQSRWTRAWTFREDEGEDDEEEEGEDDEEEEKRPVVHEKARVIPDVLMGARGHPSRAPSHPPCRSAVSS